MFTDIKGYDGYKINENGIVINKKGHMMRPAINGNGYLRVPLEVYDENGKLLHRDNKFIHRLVAEAYIPNPNNLEVVMHKDNDKLHVHYSNLEWGSQSDNIRQAFDEGRKNSPKANYPNLYEVYNDTESIKCKGISGVAELIGFSEATVRPGEIKSGKYAGYIVKNTHQKIKPAIYFK